MKSRKRQVEKPCHKCLLMVHIGGFDDLSAAEQSGKLDEILNQL